MSAEFRPNITVPLTPEQLAYIARTKLDMLNAAKKAIIPPHGECKGGFTDAVIEEETQQYEEGKLLFEYKLSAVCPVQLSTENIFHGPLFRFNPGKGKWQELERPKVFSDKKFDFK